MHILGKLVLKVHDTSSWIACNGTHQHKDRLNTSCFPCSDLVKLCVCFINDVYLTQVVLYIIS